MMDKNSQDVMNWCGKVMQYRDDGFFAEALINYLVRLGWGHGDQERSLHVKEMIKFF